MMWTNLLLSWPGHGQLLMNSSLHVHASEHFLYFVLTNSSCMILAILIDFLGARGRKQTAQWKLRSDGELMQLYRQTGELEIISHLMDRYQGLIVARTLNYLKEEEQTRDFISQLYLLLSEKLKTTEVQNFRSWLRQLITNALIDQGRRKKYFEAFMKRQEEGVTELERQLALEVDAEQLSAAVEVLEPLPRLYVLQRFFAGKQNREICEEFGLEMNDIRSARRRAFQLLRQALGPQYENYFVE